MKIVITMTSWKKRIHNVSKSIYRFLKTQTIKPNIFYLWLSIEEFPNKENDLPQDLLSICDLYGVKIKWIKDNEYCFKRWYVYPEHNKDLVISIDDDMFYHPETINECYKECILNNHPHVIHYRGCGGEIVIKNDIEYTITNNILSSSVKNYFIGQCAFSPNSYPLETLNDNIIKLRKEICPKCDESFLHPYLIKNNIPIVFLHNLYAYEDNDVQNVAIKNDLHFDLININGRNYKKADLYKLKVLQNIKDLQKSWLTNFPNYNINHLDFDFLNGVNLC